jgi:hypothetical protein
VIGTVCGVNDGALVPAVNGTSVTVAEDATTITLPSGLAVETEYRATITTSPTGEVYGVTNSIGTITSANAGNVVDACSDQAHALYGAYGRIELSRAGMQVRSLALAVAHLPYGTKKGVRVC